MFTGNSPGLDPFLQRSSAEIARDVHDAAMYAIDAFDDLRGELADSLHKDTTCTVEVAQSLLGNHGDLRQAVDALGGVMERVSGWWFTNPPPSFAPEFLSVAEAVLVACARFAASFDTTRPEWFKTVVDAVRPGADPLPESFAIPLCDEFSSLCLYAFEKAATLNYAVVGAAIKTEAMSMALRPPPEHGAMVCGSGMWTISGTRNPLTLKAVKDMARAHVNSQDRFRATGFSVWLEQRRNRSAESVSPLAPFPSRGPGRMALRDRPRGPELIQRIQFLKSRSAIWSQIQKMANEEFPELAPAGGFTEESVRKIFKRESRDAINRDTGHTA